jgi:lysophospholipase L1-like esterase
MEKDRGMIGGVRDGRPGAIYDVLMTAILCYGDSNTWGYIPGTAQRYPRHKRWPGLLQADLGPAAHVIEEGLNARTTVFDDPTKVGKSGLAYLRPCLDSHAPLDLVVLMLGTNDLKHRFGMSPADIGANVATLLGVIATSGAGLGGSAPPVLLIAPVQVGTLSNLADLFAGAVEKSKQLGRIYREVARQGGSHFLDAAEVAEVSPVDGVHLDEQGHAKLGRAVAGAVRAILSDRIG